MEAFVAARRSWQTTRLAPDVTEPNGIVVGVDVPVVVVPSQLRAEFTPLTVKLRVVSTVSDTRELLVLINSTTALSLGLVAQSVLS